MVIFPKELIAKGARKMAILVPALDAKTGKPAMGKVKLLDEFKRAPPPLPMARVHVQEMECPSSCSCSFSSKECACVGVGRHGAVHGAFGGTRQQVTGVGLGEEHVHPRLPWSRDTGVHS
jgi:hypothetical protein